MLDNFSLFQANSGSKKISKVKSKNSVSVSIDLKHSAFHIARMTNMETGSITHEEKEYKSKPYTDAFYKELTQFLTEQVQSHGGITETAFTLVISDYFVSTDTITVPNINRRKNDETVNVMVRSLYKNFSDLKVDYSLAVQNKQIATYSVTAIKKDILENITNACSEAGMTPDCITFDSNADVNAVTAANPKLKGISYVLLDIKHHTSRVVFVIKGRTAGFYSLPFGYSILTKNRVFAENMLFDHSVAELAVVNSKEKAKAKQLSVVHTENAEDDETAENTEAELDAQFGAEEDAIDDPTANAQAVAPATVKTLPKKVPRVLPKFMQRPMPKDEQEFGTENFRVFTKWVLNLIQSNERLTAHLPLEGVYVNMPQEFSYIIDSVNGEKNENKIDFNLVKADFGKAFASQNIEAMGGLFTVNSNFTNLF